MGGHPGKPLSPFLIYLLADDSVGGGGGAELSAASISVAQQAQRRGVDWFTWRIVLHPKIPDGLIDLRRWSLPDLLAAHLALDAVEQIDEIENERRDRAARLAGRRRYR